MLDQVKDAEAMRAENTKLAGERVDPAELSRLRDGQTELLRLRGQVSQLRQRLNEAAKGIPNRNDTTTDSTTNDLSPQSLVDTYTSKAVAKVAWQQTAVTGGWKLPSGNRGFVLLQPMPDSNSGAVVVRAQILEIPENLMPTLSDLKAEERESNGFGVLSNEQTRSLLASVGKTDGATILAAPQVTTLSGRQAQIQVIEMFNGQNGQSYFTGPIVEVTPTISPDNQTVEIAVETKLNVRKLRQ